MVTTIIKIFIFLLCSYISSSCLYAADSTAVPYFTNPSPIPKSETTSIKPSSSTQYTVIKTGTSAGSIQCGTNEVMVGFQVVDTATTTKAGYATYKSTKNIKTACCSILGICTNIGQSYTNYDAQLLTDPNQLTFKVYCTQAKMDFF